MEPPKTRDPSPTKLPVGFFRKASTGPSASGRTEGHKRTNSATGSAIVRKDSQISRSGQSSALRAVKEATAQVEGDYKTKAPITRKVTPAARGAHVRTASRGSVDLRTAANEKAKTQLNKSTTTAAPAKPPVSRARNISGSAKAPPPKEQKSTPQPSSNTPRIDEVPQHSLIESSLELLQLHAIHSRSAETQSEWAESARKFYEGQFKEIVAFREAVQNREKDLLLQRNASAVIEWGSRGGGDTLERRIHVLSGVLDKAWQLTGSTGRYTAIVQAFEHWYEEAAKAQEHQASSSTSINLAEGLGDGWKAEVASIQEVALEAANAILSLGDIQGDSDLARTITMLLELIKNMLEELELMDSIEQGIVLQQQFWVQRSLNDMKNDI